MEHLTVYLSGEIHTNWRQRIQDGAQAAELNVSFLAPVCDHETSDDCGVEILGEESKAVWKDHQGARLNAIRTRSAMAGADVVVVRFGDKFRQWNAAFEAGVASALGKSLVTLHDEALTHPLKEVNAAALASCQTPEQVVRILQYVVRGTL